MNTEFESPSFMLDQAVDLSIFLSSIKINLQQGKKLCSNSTAACTKDKGKVSVTVEQKFML